MPHHHALLPSILVVDDDQDSRTMLRCLLGDGFRVHDASSGEDALQRLDAHHAKDVFDVILMDLIMPGMGGIEAIDRIRHGAHHVDIPVIAMTVYSDVPMAVRAMKAGATDFIEKPVEKNTLRKCVQQCLNTSTPLPSMDADGLSSLTAREREVMALLVQGEMNKQIAVHLQISIRTVETHRAAIKKKLRVKTIAELVRIGLQASYKKNSLYVEIPT